MAGWLLTVVVWPNGFRSCGSRCTADRTRRTATTAMPRPAIAATELRADVLRSMCMRLPGTRGSIPLFSAYSGAAGHTSGYAPVLVWPRRPHRAGRPLFTRPLAAALAALAGRRMPYVDTDSGRGAGRAVADVRRLPEGGQGERNRACGHCRTVTR